MRTAFGNSAARCATRAWTNGSLAGTALAPSASNGLRSNRVGSPIAHHRSKRNFSPAMSTNWFSRMCDDIADWIADKKVCHETAHCELHGSRSRGAATVPVCSLSRRRIAVSASSASRSIITARR
jgi:hypothetical protein